MRRIEMNDDLIHEVDELLLKFDTIEELQELIDYIEQRIMEREEFEWEDGGPPRH